ncbi:MAG: methyltransferase [Clostridia bacterium]|nr:methyltransferase [Clostridia bacterium]
MNEIPHKKRKPSFDPRSERADEINEDLTLISLKDGLLFGTDSYLLAAFTRSYPKGVAADLGAGCGVISLLCAQKNKYSRIVSVEISETTASICKRNTELNGLSERIDVIRADVRQVRSDDLGGQVDAVFSNPPYMIPGTGKENDNNELNAARRELNGNIRDFCLSASRILKYGGTFTVVWRPERLCDLLCAMRDVKIEPKRAVFVHPFHDSPPSLVLVEGKSGAAPGLIFSRPLVIYENRGDGKYTSDAEKIYETFSAEHLFNKTE